MEYSSHTTGSSLAPVPEMETDAIRAMQHTYRRLLDAMSRPGNVWQIVKHPHLQAETPIAAEWIASVVMTLIDHEVSMHLVESPSFVGLQDVIDRRTRAQVTTADSADFVVADLKTFDENLIEVMKTGNLDYPNDGATLILQIEDLGNTSGPSIVLNGPGINGSLNRPLGDLNTGLIAARNAATADYPLGIDVIVVDGYGKVMALPRTTSISVQDGDL